MSLDEIELRFELGRIGVERSRIELAQLIAGGHPVVREHREKRRAQGSSCVEDPVDQAQTAEDSGHRRAYHEGRSATSSSTTPKSRRDPSVRPARLTAPARDT